MEQRDLDVLVHPFTSIQDHMASGPLVIERGKGVRLYDLQGRAYIDTLAGLANVAVGYGRTEFSEPVAKQLADLAYVPAFFGLSNPRAIELAERLVQILPAGLGHIFFTNGGSESNETAFKIARFFWHQRGKPNKVKIISRLLGYHGMTMATTTATGIQEYKEAAGPQVESIVHTLAPYPYRPPCGANSPEECGELCAQALEDTIRREGKETVAAFIAEPVLGASGLIPPSDNYLKRCREICTENDVLFIADEVITGFGRTGSWFASQTYGFTPDLLCMAKGITSGYLPLGAVAISEDVYAGMAETNTPFHHGFTYSGHSTCCTAGLVNLDIIEREGLIENARRQGELLLRRLRELQGQPFIGDVRGVGLMAAVELVKDPATREAFGHDLKVGDRVSDAAREHGLILRSSHDSLMFAPALMVSAEEIEEIVERFRRTLDAVLPQVAREVGAG
jgi:adenosylmethionine-8-amino-7-oxononanoate aminotransferase